MAKLRGNLFGNFQGKIGLTYGRMVHGVNLGANMPVKRDNNKATQQMWDLQKRFAELAQMASGFLTAIKMGLKTYAKNIGPLVSEFDAFVKLNKDAVHVEGATKEVEYGEIKISKGNLTQVGFGAASFDEPLRVEVPFSGNTDAPDADNKDKVYLAILEPMTSQVVLSEGVERAAVAAKIGVHLPSTWSGLTVHVYGFTVAGGTANKGKVSDSVYIGTGEVG